MYINVCGIEQFDLGKICGVKVEKCVVLNDDIFFESLRL